MGILVDSNDNFAGIRVKNPKGNLRIVQRGNISGYTAVNERGKIIATGSTERRILNKIIEKGNYNARFNDGFNTGRIRDLDNEKRREKKQTRQSDEIGWYGHVGNINRSKGEKRRTTSFLDWGRSGGI